MLIRVARSLRGLTSQREIRDGRSKVDHVRAHLARKSTWRESYFLAAFLPVEPLEEAERFPLPWEEWRVATRHEKNRGDHQTV
jgi:hypothetical protein